MPRQHTNNGGTTLEYSEHFRGFHEEFSLSWSEIARWLDTYRINVWRWATCRARPNFQRWRALLALAEDEIALISPSGGG